MKFSYKQLKLIIQFQIKLKLNITSYFYDFFEIFKCIYMQLSKHDKYFAMHQ